MVEIVWWGLFLLLFGLLVLGMCIGFIGLRWIITYQYKYYSELSERADAALEQHELYDQDLMDPREEPQIIIPGPPHKKDMEGVSDDNIEEEDKGEKEKGQGGPKGFYS